MKDTEEGPLDFFELQIKKHVEEMRPPLEIRPQLDIGYSWKDLKVEIFEIRPRFDDPSKIHHMSFAKAWFIKSQSIWKVYWMRASGKWELYEPHPECKTLKEFFDLVDEDAYQCFKG